MLTGADHMKTCHSGKIYPKGCLALSWLDGFARCLNAAQVVALLCDRVTNTLCPSSEHGEWG